MWRMDDDDFSCSAPSQSFILPASQEETQEDQPLSPGKRMRRTLANLPALQDRSGNLQSGRGQGSEQGQGLRFSLFPASQDIFSDSEEDEDNVLTPAAHLGSLQISQKPMLVPETVEDTTENEIPPSPEAYGSTPCIIPSSPTDQSDNQSDEKHENIGATRNQQQDNESSGVSFDFLADETLASESQIKETDRTVIHRREMERSDQLSGDIEKKTPEKSDEKSISSQSLEARLAMPTLVDDGGRKEPVYLNLTVSSTQPSQSIEIVDVLPPPSSHEGMRQVAGVSLGLATSQSLLGTEVPHRDIIVIPSGSAPSQHGVIESDDYGLRLSPSQLQSSRATQVSKNTDSHSTQSNSVHMTHSKKDLIEKESENSEIGEKVRGDKSAVDSKPTLSSKDSTESRKSASQGVEGKHCASEGQARRSSSEPRSFENNRESRRNKRMLDLLNNDPLVLWKNDSDTEKKILDASVRSSEKYTEEFHLEIPRESASDPVTEIPRSQHAKRCVEHMDSKSQPGKEPAITCPTEDKMAIENIHTESEPVTQPEFRLLKPDFKESEDFDEEEEIIPIQRSMGRRKYILDDSDDEMLSTRERDTLVLPSDPPSNHADPPSKPGDPDFVLASGQYLAQKIPAEEAMDDTQTYDPVEVGLMSGAFDHNKSQSAAGTNTEQAVDITESKDEVIVTAKNSSEHSLKGGNIKSGVHASVSDELSVCSEPIMPGNLRERGLTESSTQTQEGKPKSVFEGVDVNVVQKVAEYLTSGYAPRSRTNSTCTDISDQHGEGSEKSDSVMKTPQPRKAMDKHRSPGSSRMRRESSDQKSPQEVKDIVKTYSNILQKSAMKQKQREEMRETATTSSQRTNPESVLPSKAAVPRRLSTQSMPDGVHSSYIKSSQQFTATLNRTLSSQPDWITAKKPTSQGFITSKTPKNSSQGSLEIFPPKSLDKSNDNTKHESFPENSAESVSANIQASEGAPETLHSVTIEDADLDLIGVKIMDSDIAKPAGIENASFPTVSSQNKQSVPLTETKNLTQKVPKHEQKLEISTKSTPVKVKGQIPQSHSGRPSNNSKKKKRLISVEKRNKIRRTLDSGSPQMGTGSFVSGTQKFKSIDSGEGKTRDPYKFESSQSQISPNQTSRATGGSGQQERTPLSTRKRPARLIHKKTGLKKQKTDNPSTQSRDLQNPMNMVTSPVSESQSTDVTVTTVGSLASLPSSISQSSPARDILSPSSSSSRQSVTDEIKGRLSGKRLSIEQSLPDTLPLPQSDEDHYQRVTIVIEKVERVFREITTTKKVVGPDGAVIESSQDVKRLDPVIVEESTHKKVQYIYIPSPSRSVTSMTSGDLADISSSISKSSGSLGSKVSLTSSSLDHSDGGQSVSKHLQTQSSVETSQQAAKPVRRQHSMDSQKKGSSGQSDSDKMEAPKAVPRNVRTQSGSNLAAKPPLQPPTGHTPKTRLSVQTSGTSGLGTAAPESPTVTRPKSATPGHSDHDVSGVVTPLGSTINGSGNYLHSRTVSMESPRMSSSLFSSSDSAGQQRNEQVPASKTTEIVTESSSSDHLHPEQKRASSPQQDQAVSSSNTPPDVAMVTSSGAPGSRVLAKWKDGFYYPGVLRTSPDRLSKCSVRFDDGDSMHVKISDILLIGRLPAGQSVMVLTEDGDFEFGLVLQQTVDRYVVETDEGKNASYSFSQVILSSDQAACIISDHGPEVQLQGCTTSHSSTGNVSLENLVDEPRRSAKKLPANKFKETVARERTEDEGGGRGRSRKRKLEPQATSTPTPKGKAESGASKRQRVQDPSSSPVRGIQDSPAGARKSPRKPRVELFTSDLGPLPTRKLFRGLNFLLTNVEKTQGQRQEERQLLKNPLDTSTDDSSNDDENGPLFNKDHLKAQIEAGGGAVLEDLDEQTVNSDKKIILLSSAYQRTIKYLKCLATGISCVSYMWVVDSCTQGALLDQVSYVLPAGISLEKKKIIEWRKKKDIFLNMKAVVCSKKPKFTESWTNILQLAKCQVVNKLQNGVNFLLTDQSCSATMERQARNHSVPLVSTEWVIQSLVNGKPMGYQAHPRYSHEFSV